MPTPPMSDEEFDARFRQGLQNYPEQPVDPAAWRSMNALLDADNQHHALRRQLLNGFGSQVLVVVLALALGLWWATPRGAAGAPAAATAPAGEAPAAVASRPRPAAALPGPGKPIAQNLAEPTATRLARGPKTTAGAAAPATHELAASASVGASKAGSLAGRSSGAVASAPRAAAAGFTRGTGSPQTFSPSAERGHAVTAGTGRAAGPLLAAAAHQPRGHRRRPAGRSLAGPAAAQRSTARQNPSPVAGDQRGTGQPGSRLSLAGSGQEVTATPAAAGPAPAAAGPVAALALLGLGGVPVAPLPGPLALLPLARPTDSLATPTARPATAYRLLVGLVGAPELSNVRSGPLTGPGRDLGLQLEVRLARRWRLNTGYLLAAKRYVAEGADYHQPAGYPMNDLVRANCRIIDLPLNLRYDLWQQPRFQVFVSAGLSSLLMRREDYTYNYTDKASGMPKTATWNLLNGSNHFLQVLNLSAGYERALGGRWTAQAEPFVKLPLAGLGYGAVRLNSAGIFLSLKYGLFPLPAAGPPAAP